MVDHSRTEPDDFGVSVKRKDSFMLETIGDGNVLVPLGAQVMDLNGIVTLNTTGRYIWELLAEDQSIEEIAAAVAERFDVDPETAHTDIQVFLDEIARIGLLEN